MVIISGDTIDIAALAGEYRPGGVERELLETMSQSAVTYRYNSIDQLRFELMLRKEIVDAAVALNNSGMAFSTFHKSRSNEEYWERMDNGGFKLQDGASPARAIMDIYQNGRAYATECATAMQVVYYRAILEVFGPEAFSSMFPRIYLMNWHNLNPLIEGVGIPRRADDMLIGDRVYFQNPDVDPKTPEWQGENAIVLPRGLFYGHGAGIRNEESMIRAINAHRRQGATRSAYLRDVVGRLDYKQLADMYDRPVSHTVQPARSVQAAPPAQAVQPAHPAQAAQPTQPVQPVQHTQPVQAVQPAQPVQPIQTVQHAQPVQTVQPVQPAQHSQPGQRAHLVWSPFPAPVSSARVR